MPSPSPTLAEVRVPIMLDRERSMVFNVNSMIAFEQVSGKFFLATVSELYAAVFPNGEDKKPSSALDILKKVSMVDLRALLWASIHEYDEADNPVWPLTISQVGRYIRLQNLLPVFTSFLQGQISNNPTRSELGESRAETRNPVPTSISPPKTAAPGGERGIELPVDAFS